MKIFTTKYWQEVFSLELIIKTTLQTVIGTVMVASFFMVFTDFIFKPIDLTGRWDMELKPNKAMSISNRCVDITYSVLFTQKGTVIVGGGEKSRDTKSTHADCNDQEIFEREIDPGKGKKIQISGYLQNNYLSQDSISISYQEGDKNSSRFTVASLGVRGEDEIVGWYKSAISRAEGILVLSRVR